jgi:hypothetical protein
LLQDDAIGSVVKDIHRGIDVFHGTDIGVGIVEDVFLVGLAVILMSERHYLERFFNRV